MRFSLYGFLLGLSFVIAFWLAEHILKKSFPKNTKTVNWSAAMGAVFVSGLAGARLWHVFTDWSLYAERPWPAILEVWNGGLGIYGGLVGGTFGLWVWFQWQKKDRRLTPDWTFSTLLDTAAIVLPFAQALGRWGNYVNQELFGPPTTAPWGIFIRPENRPTQWQEFERFHPLFLYESIANLILGTFLWLIWRKSRELPKELRLFQLGSGFYGGMYCLGYGIVRFLLDFSRYDLTHFGPLTGSQWFSGGLVVFGLLTLLRATSEKFWSNTVVKSVLFFLLLFVLIIPWVKPPRPRAQSTAAVNLKISPAIIEFTLKPGKNVTKAIELTNQGAMDLAVTLQLQDFVSDGKTGHPILQEQSTFPYASLANADRKLGEEFVLPAGQTQQLVLALNIPEEAELRDWYFVLLASTKALERGRTEGPTRSQGAIAATVLVKVANTIEPRFSWEVLVPNLPHWIDSLQSLSFLPIVTNNTATVNIPELIVTVENWRGDTVYEAKGLPDRVLAMSSREILAAQASKELPNSQYGIPFTYDPPFAFGPHTLRVTITNNDTGPVHFEHRFWAVPVSIGIAFGAFLAGLLFMSLLRRK